MKVLDLKKLILTVGAMLSLTGCLSSSFYVLSTASQPAKTYAYKKQVIGVEKITVPEYLFKREIAVAKSASQVTFLSNATWAEDLDSGLTLRLISFLQKKFNQPHVHQYPWGLDNQPTQKVKVQISRFIAQDDRVFLDATWEVENISKHTHKARLFSTQVATSSRANSIVSAMDIAFGELEETIAQGLR
jgi:cholesterol transport system auxiliary component